MASTSTGSRLTRAELEGLLDRYRLVFENSCDVVLIISVDGIIEWVSPAIRAMLGWEPHEVVGVRPVDLVHPDDEVVAQYSQAELSAGHPVAVQLRYRTRAGDHVWVSARAQPFSRDGRIAGRVATWRDIRGERAAIESATEPHVHLVPIRDVDGQLIDFKISSANSAAAEFLALAPHELRDRYITEVLPIDDARRFRDHLGQVLEMGRPLILDDVHHHDARTGQPRVYDIRFIPHGEAVAASLRDVTDRFLRFEARSHAEARESLSAERERVARDLHDGAIQKVFATSMRLAALVGDVSDVVRRRLEDLIDLQDAVIRDLRATVYQLGTTGRSAGSPVRMFRTTVLEAGRALGFSPDVVIDENVDHVDDTTLGHLMLVVREALSNVARHAQAHHVEVTLDGGDVDVELRVRDDGIGLDPNARRGEGVANIERRAQLLGGSCQFVSTAGHGTELVWRVPLAVVRR